MSAVRSFLARVNRPSTTIGTTETPIDAATAAADLDALGDAGDHARALDRAVEASLGDPGGRSDGGGLSELTSDVALRYLERVRHALAALTLEDGVTLITCGYVAHRAVEADSAAYGCGPEVPVLGNLPDLRKGRPPQDLALRVVKASRRNFDRIRAVSDDVWEGFVVATTARIQASEGGPRVLDRTVVDGLLRFGWILRQVDLHYDQA